MLFMSLSFFFGQRGEIHSRFFIAESVYESMPEHGTSSNPGYYLASDIPRDAVKALGGCGTPVPVHVSVGDWTTRSISLRGTRRLDRGRLFDKNIIGWMLIA